MMRSELKVLVELIIINNAKIGDGNQANAR